MSEKLLIFIFILSIIIIVASLSFYFSKKQRTLRALSKFKAKRIIQFKTNELTKVSGKVIEVEMPFIAPLSKRKCVAYVFKVEKKVKRGKNSHWTTLVEKEDIQDFFIEQKGELVMVKPSKEKRDYNIYMVEDKRETSGTFNDPTPDFKKVLEDFGIESTSWLGFNVTLKYTERILEIGETITVGGLAKWKSLSNNVSVKGYNYSRIAAIESSPNQKIIITDHPKAIKPVERRL